MSSGKFHLSCNTVGDNPSSSVYDCRGLNNTRNSGNKINRTRVHNRGGEHVLSIILESWFWSKYVHESDVHAEMVESCPRCKNKRNSMKICVIVARLL